MSFLSWVHMLVGTVAFVAGAGAMSFAKGHKKHRVIGQVFVAVMLATGISGFLMALYRLEPITMLAGILTCYLVLTGWATVRRSSRDLLLVENTLGVAAIGISLGAVSMGVLAFRHHSGAFHGYPAADYFLVGGIALLAALGDVYRFVAGRQAGGPRIARHLWRMCTGMFFATGSLFTGPGASVFPAAVQASGLLVIPEIVVFLFMVFWLIRVAVLKRGAVRATI